jgi:hypothetical protein
MERSTQAPRAPLSANAVRNSFPSPRAAPVTTQVFPSRENDGRVITLERCCVVRIDRKMDLLRTFRRATVRANIVVEVVARKIE